MSLVQESLIVLLGSLGSVLRAYTPLHWLLLLLNSKLLMSIIQIGIKYAVLIRSKLSHFGERSIYDYIIRRLIPLIIVVLLLKIFQMIWVLQNYNRVIYINEIIVDMVIVFLLNYFFYTVLSKLAQDIIKVIEFDLVSLNVYFILLALIWFWYYVQWLLFMHRTNFSTIESLMRGLLLSAINNI